MNILTVDDMITEVREQADETNQSGPRTDEAILRSLNRGLRLGNGVLATSYPEPLLKSTSLDLGLGRRHSLPADCFEDRAEWVRVDTPDGGTETRRMDLRDSARLHSQSTPSPFSWHVEGRELVFQQTPTGTYDATLFYVRRLEKLVVTQGRIIDIGATYVDIDPDTLGDGVTASANLVTSYVNLINWQTGEVRGTLQIASISTDGRVTFRATPVRSTVLGKSVSGSADLADLDAEVDDYICLVHGTCVPFFQDTLGEHLIQYGVDSATRALGGDARLEKAILDECTARVERARGARDTGLQVKNRSGVWPSTTRRWPSST